MSLTEYLIAGVAALLLFLMGLLKLKDRTIQNLKVENMDLKQTAAQEPLKVKVEDASERTKKAEEELNRRLNEYRPGGSND